MAADVLPPLQAQARIAFICALGTNTDAIRELREWQPSASARASERGAAQRALEEQLIDEWARRDVTLPTVSHLFDPVALRELMDAIAGAEQALLPTEDEPVDGVAEPVDVTGDHAPDPFGLRHVELFNEMHAMLRKVASEERVREARAWCARWHLFNRLNGDDAAGDARCVLPGGRVAAGAAERPRAPRDGLAAWP
jgi:hypothetical protein